MDDFCIMVLDDTSWSETLIEVVYELLPTTPSWDDVSDIAGIVTALATCGLFAVAWFQLHKISDNQRRWTTLQACDRYDTDPILTEQRKLLRARLRNSRSVKDSDVQFALNTLLNYFDAIAIGINQKLYMRSIAEAHLGSVMHNWLKRLDNTRDTVVNKELANVREYYPDLIEYYGELWDRKKWREEYPSFLKGLENKLART